MSEQERYLVDSKSTFFSPFIGILHYSISCQLVREGGGGNENSYFRFLFSLVF